MIQFFIEDIANTTTQLPESDSAHCIRVLRMKQGEQIICVDGKGNRYTCKITEAHPKHCGIEIISKEEVPTHWINKITLCFAPTKNMDRVEWMLEKCTELGIDQIIPVECTNSERRVIKTERLQKILISAMKQSLKAVLPKLEPLTPLKEVINRYCDFKGSKYICYCSDQVQRTDLACVYDGKSDIVILIGPEGDFTPEEVDKAISSGWTPVTLGDSRLRTETAGVTAVADAHCIIRQNKCKI